MSCARQRPIGHCTGAELPSHTVYLDVRHTDGAEVIGVQYAQDMVEGDSACPPGEISQTRAL